MMIKPYSLKLLKQEDDIVPHAVLSVPVWDIAKRLKFKLEQEHDDFDYYIGVGAQSDTYPFAIIHYRGHPEGTSTIYLPSKFSGDVDKITDAVHSITAQLGLDDESISWERKNDPSL